SRSNRTGYGSTPRARRSSRSARRRARSAGRSGAGASSSGIRLMLGGGFRPQRYHSAAATRRTNMEAVIAAPARTPTRRANTGSPAALGPDDLGAPIVRALLEKAPAVDPAEVEDVIWGCAQPAGEAGYNVARVTALLAGLEGVPGVTVNRYCSSSLQTIRM